MRAAEAIDGLPGRQSRAARLRRGLDRADRRLLGWAVRGRSPASNTALTLLSRAADNGKLWYATAGLLAASGQRRPRTAAAAGLLGMGLASGLVNGPLKFLWQRDRPASELLGERGALLPLPRTYSFPSGHSASAFAFATAVSRTLPAGAPAVLPAAAAVAYSRVHTGVHYPSDVLVGSALGAGAGYVASRIATSVRESSVHRPDAPTIDVPIPRRAVLLASEGAGSADGIDAARQVLTDGGIAIVDDIAVEDSGRLTELLQREAADPPLVIAAGGDGTVGCAAGLVHGTEALLAILPLGTSNDVARSLGIPPDACEAARAIVDGRVCAVDAGCLHVEGKPPRIYVNAATAGLNVAFAKLATHSRMRERFGGLTYPVAAALALRRYQPFECTVDADCTPRSERMTLPVVHLSIGNATLFGGVLGMRVPGASMSDGSLDVIVIERLSIARLALAVADTVIGRHRPVHGVHALKVRSVSVRADAGQPVAVDGEVVGELPAEFSILPAALRVVVPAEDPTD